MSAGGPVPRIGDAASTPLPTQADDRRQDGQFVMLETLEQLCGRSRGWIVRSKVKGAIASIVLISYSK